MICELGYHLFSIVSNCGCGYVIFTTVAANWWKMWLMRLQCGCRDYQNRNIATTSGRQLQFKILLVCNLKFSFGNWTDQSFLINGGNSVFNKKYYLRIPQFVVNYAFYIVSNKPYLSFLLGIQLWVKKFKVGKEWTKWWPCKMEKTHNAIRFWV